MFPWGDRFWRLCRVPLGSVFRGGLGSFDPAYSSELTHFDPGGRPVSALISLTTRVRTGLATEHRAVLAGTAPPPLPHIPPDVPLRAPSWLTPQGSCLLPRFPTHAFGSDYLITWLVTSPDWESGSSPCSPVSPTLSFLLRCVWLIVVWRHSPCSGEGAWISFFYIHESTELRNEVPRAVSSRDGRQKAGGGKSRLPWHP